MKNIIYIICAIVSLPILGLSQICPGEEGKLVWEAYFGTFDDEIGHLTAAYDYPNRPDVTKTVYKTQTPINYSTDFGGRLRGYINVPQATDVTFNITGDDHVYFYLSTDSNPDNKALITSITAYASVTDHDKYPEQTSSMISLSPNIDYYFELLYVEDSGGDHASLYWKTDLVDSDNWNLITAMFLKAVDCTDDVCPQEGTACDDGNAATENDIEDGFCNCSGSATTTNTCVGDRGILEAYRFENIPGYEISALYEAPNFPGVPDYGYNLPQFSRPYANDMDDFGVQIQAYLSVPVTGNYKFNVTGNDNTVLFISSDETPENKQAHQALVSGSSNMVQHDKYIWQSTGNINLIAGQYYYVELNFKAATGGDHYSIFWQSPFTETDTWKRIPATYFYDYGCEVACIPQNTPCDDGDPFTNNDVYDDNCTCAGTPCSGPDCDSPLANYVPYDKCSVTDQLDNNPENNWLSCGITPNPNNSRSDGHWIMYNLGERHELHQSQVWNYNVENETDKGFQSVAVDVSDDGITWTEYGLYTWNLATGESGYSGFSGPHFQGEYAQYVMFTSLDDPSTCRGLGKVAFTAVLCPLAETPCDDGDIYTINDRYDNNCLCTGDQVEENECQDENLTLGDSTLYTDIFSAEAYVNSISKIASNNVVSFVGGSSVTLNPGFETEDNTLFIATIDTCDTAEERLAQIALRSEIISQNRQDQEETKLLRLKVSEIENTDLQSIKFYIPEGGQVDISIIDLSDTKVFDILSHEFTNQGVYEKKIRTKKFDSGVYNVLMTYDGYSIREKIVVTR